MSKQELSKHAGRQTCSLQERRETVEEGPPSSQDKKQIKDDAVLIKHQKYGGRIFTLVYVATIM